MLINSRSRAQGAGTKWIWYRRAGEGKAYRGAPYNGGCCEPATQRQAALLNAGELDGPCHAVMCSKSAPHTYSWRNPRSKVRSHAPHAKNHDRNGGAKNEPSAGHPKSLLRTKQEIDKRKAKHSLASCKRESCVSSVSRRSACTENAEKTGSWRDARRGGGGARAPKWRVWLYMG
jgi:hypothetical protein